MPQFLISEHNYEKRYKAHVNHMDEDKDGKP